MNKLSIDLKNCFGIEKLKYDFDFSKDNIFSIYAKNGLMKTSLAKTFRLIQEGKADDISDAIFEIDGQAEVLVDGTPIEKEQVFVIKSYESAYESDISPLLVKGEIQEQLKDVFELLLSSDGFEIYMKPAKYYLEITDGMESDIFSIVDAVAEKHEIFIGYCLKSEQNGGPILNPPKMRNGKLRYVKLCSDDQFVVLAEDPMIKN